MYDSQVTFTLDTICPWTFVAKKRFDEALAQVRSSPGASEAKFTVHYDPYQLYPEFADSEDKRKWYLTNKHNDNPAAQEVFIAHMNNIIEPQGVTLNFDGTMGNTLQAHRIIQYFQEEKGPEVADRLVNGLYRRYFTEAKHPSSDETLLEACVEAGIDEKEAKDVIQDREKGERKVKDKMRTVSRDVDAVPVIVIEGRRRDLTLTGAKEVADYVKAMETIIKESS